MATYSDNADIVQLWKMWGEHREHFQKKHKHFNSISNSIGGSHVKFYNLRPLCV